MLVLLAGCVPADPLPFGATSEDCAICHASHADEWRASSHAASAESPVFQALLPPVEDAWGAGSRQACEGCHSPGIADEPGIGCVACHAAVGNHGERDGLLAVDLTAPLAGPLEGAGVTTEAHVSGPRSLLESPVLCGTCHEVTGPELFVERTFSEHLAAPGADTCVSCHSPQLAERVLTADTPARASRDHRFVGFDPSWTDVSDPVAAEATRALLDRALDLHVDAVAGEVVLTNVGGGHDVPTGVAFLRAIWVEAHTEEGVVEVLTIGDEPLRSGSAVALVTDADEVRTRRLAPGASARAPLPPGASRVVLRATAVRPEVLGALGLNLELPVHEVEGVDLE